DVHTREEWTRSYGLYLPDRLTPYPTDDLPLSRAMRGETVNAAEGFVRRDDLPPGGGWLSVNARPLRDEAGKVRGGVAIFRDTTEHRNAQEALAKERNLLRTLMDGSPDYIFVKDTHSRFLTTHPAHLQELGAATPEQVVGRTDFDFFPRELAVQYYADEQSVITTGRPLVNRVEQAVSPSGRRRWLLTTKVPLRDAKGTVTGLVGVCRDVTALKR